MQKSLKGLEKFFWLYLLFNPVLDIVNGLYIWMLTRGYAGMEALNYRELTNSGGMTTTPALIVRMLVLVVMVVYVLLLREAEQKGLPPDYTSAPTREALRRDCGLRRPAFIETEKGGNENT